MARNINSTQYGKQAELLAQRFLQKQNFDIHTTNYYTRYGEIDIIAVQDGTLVFTEVKARSTCSAYDVITQAKVKKICKTALKFIVENPQFQSYDMRFDLVHIVGSNIHSHIENAWDFVE